MHRMQGVRYMQIGDSDEADQHAVVMPINVPG
jgi:hypothetical protein